MDVTAIEVSQAFEQVLSGAKTREEVSSWARRVRQAEDGGSLEYVPPDREGNIWEAIQFLEGVDLRDSPDSYLHVEADIVAARNKVGL